ncbi:MAG: hypothetical protein AAGE37_09785 [Pseudomonadota bacterium]
MTKEKYNKILFVFVLLLLVITSAIAFLHVKNGRDIKKVVTSIDVAAANIHILEDQFDPTLGLDRVVLMSMIANEPSIPIWQVEGVQNAQFSVLSSGDFKIKDIVVDGKRRDYVIEAEALKQLFNEEKNNISNKETGKLRDLIDEQKYEHFETTKKLNAINLNLQYLEKSISSKLLEHSNDITILYGLIFGFLLTLIGITGAPFVVGSIEQKKSQHTENAPAQRSEVVPSSQNPLSQNGEI